MVISTGDIPPGPPQFVLAHSLPPRYYWRGYTYDLYTGRGWRTEGTQTINYGAGEPAVFGDRSRAEFDRQYGRDVPMTLPGHRTVRQAVRVVGDVGGLLYVAGNLVTADQNYSVAWRPPEDAFGANIGATTYRADSLVTAVSEKELRSAGSDYPEWVRNRYLTLPDEVPARVKSLALDLTATAPTPYDRARAIEAYLRTFTYTLDVPTPPFDQDVADYFLFDLKKGYCDYYATAMVVLARAAGLPARLAMGYATGDYDIFNARYIVTEADAHSWPEIYFPGYDWIEFEPTAGLPPIRRPAETAPLVFSGPRGILEPLVARRVWLGWLQRLGLPGGLTLLIVGGVVWAIADGWRLRRLPPDAAAAMLYQRLYHHGRRLDVPVRAGDTPYEFAASLTERLTDLAQKRRWGKLLTPAIQEVLYLTDLYVQVCYSPHQPDAADRVEAIHAWQRLRRRLWLARV
jgi:transglutaminase-like putative cysteine protease